MSSSINASLESINKTADSLKSLYFTPSGIFTNALTLKPYITKLIRDAQDFESAMYTVDKETEEARRKDGSKSFFEINEDADELLQDVEDEVRQPTVKIPKVKIDPVMEKEDSKIQSILSKLNNEDYSVDELIESVKQIVGNNLSLLSNYSDIMISLKEKKTRFETLNSEVTELEDILSLQRQQLNKMNNSINDKQLLSASSSNKASAKDLIAKEEEEIRQLELLLTNRKKEERELSNSIVNSEDQ